MWELTDCKLKKKQLGHNYKDYLQTCSGTLISHFGLGLHKSWTTKGSILASSVKSVCFCQTPSIILKSFNWNLCPLEGRYTCHIQWDLAWVFQSYASLYTLEGSDYGMAQSVRKFLWTQLLQFSVDDLETFFCLYIYSKFLWTQLLLKILVDCLETL